MPINPDLTNEGGTIPSSLSVPAPVREEIESVDPDTRKKGERKLSKWLQDTEGTTAAAAGRKAREMAAVAAKKGWSYVTWKFQKEVQELNEADRRRREARARKE